MRVNVWRGGEATVKELALNSVFAPDTRLAIVRRVFEALPGTPLSRGLSPSEKRYMEALLELIRKRDASLKIALIPAEEEGIIRRNHFFEKGVIGCFDSKLQSSSIMSLLSLAPVIRRLMEGGGMLAAVDTVELHLTPLFQASVAINLARLAGIEWMHKEELLRVTPCSQSHTHQ